MLPLYAFVQVRFCRGLFAELVFPECIILVIGLPLGC
jgi:hypothetical protein